ncbi:MULTISPECIES: DUF5819 family protein [Streptomyces]|uniref:DUF5819 family protein n=1 Tax=Streptomyces TaxID=1883 RepID=UPI003396B80D
MTRRAVLLVGAALLGLHFLLAAFSQSPYTPMKLRYYDKVSDYLDPYFAQNWMLFAPDPLADDRGILARAKCADGRVTEYYDVTSPYIHAAQDSRFFPSRMSRLVGSSLQSLYNSDPLLDRVRKSEKEKEKPVLPLMPYEKSSREDAVRFLSRYSMTQMPQACGGDPRSIQIRMYVRELPPWSKRDDPSAKDSISVQDFGWQKAGDLR